MMDFSAYFKRRYGQQLEELNETDDYTKTWSLWEQIAFDEEFSQEDFFELLDYLVELSSSVDESSGFPFPMDLISPLYNIVLQNIDDKYFENWDDVTKEKYHYYFLSKNDTFSLNDLIEPIASYYGTELNWDMIMANTFFIENNEEVLNSNAYMILEKYYNIIFDTTINNDTFAPADATEFLYCYKYGVEFPFDFLRNSLVENSTTFSDYLMSDGKLQEIFELGYPYVYNHVSSSSEDTEFLDVCLAPLNTRLSIENNWNSTLEDTDEVVEYDDIDIDVNDIANENNDDFDF